MMPPNNPALFVVIPAAGCGRRMLSDVPKQYLPLNGKPMLHFSLELFCLYPKVSSVERTRHGSSLRKFMLSKH